MKEELIKRIGDHCDKWNGKQLSLDDVVVMHREKCELLIDLYKYLLTL